ncbi:MAG: hypothetical protein NVSMB51_13470 [Solirubrobacteraceae bacterium]
MRAVAGLLSALSLFAAAHKHHPPKHHVRPAPKPLSKPTWLTGVRVTEYFPVPESWFNGALVSAPGLDGAHHVDWLYSASGLAVEGDGTDLQGQPAHVATVGGSGFVDAAGHRTSSAPAWISGGYWLTSAHALTYPLAAGGWSAGTGVRYRQPPRKLTFAPGRSLPLIPYRSLAVDPALIPLGSMVYIPSYVGLDGASGWFVAQDTGTAIKGRHVDVYREPPATRAGVRSFQDQRILVLPPGTAPPAGGTAGGVAVPAAALSCAAPNQEPRCPKP